MKYETGLVSVITPVYAAEDFIEETIKSVIKQTYTKWEMIIVNDSSPDKSVAIIKELMKKEKRIKLFELDVNSGAAVARNRALEEAKGQYVAFLDSDDLWMPRKLEDQLAFMKHRQASFTYTYYQLMNEKGKLLHQIVRPPEVLTYKDLLTGNAIGCLTVVIDRGHVGDFRMPLIRRGQDYASWLMIMRQGFDAHLFPMNMAYYRQVKGSLSDSVFISMKRTWYIYRQVEHLSKMMSLYYFIHYLLKALRKRL